MFEQIIVIGGLIIGIILFIISLFVIGLMISFGGLEIIFCSKKPILTTIAIMGLTIKPTIQFISICILGVVRKMLGITKLIPSGKKERIIFVILVIGCFVTSIGIGINFDLAFKIGIILITLSVIATRLVENREFQTINHDLALYQHAKLQNGIVTFGIGIMFLIATVYLTGIVAIGYYTMPSLIVLGIGAGKMMKFSFIKRSSPEILSFVIKVKYFYKDTTELIAKAMNFKMSQQAQRVAT